jgi:signal transduction histidine kinase
VTNTPPALRVLVADDTPDLRELLRFALERQGGFTVVGEAADGLEAVALARREQPDAVLLDLAMPQMDGLQAIPEILAASPATKIVVFSGFEAAALANEALERGAQAYLPKGTMPAGIAAKLREVCGAPSPPAPRDSRRIGRSTSDIISALVHELRNQVTVVEGFAQTIARNWDDLADAQRRDYLERVVRNAAQIRALVDVFADANRVGSDELELSLVATSLEGLVREIVDDLAVTSSRKVELEVQRDARVRADPIRLRQVLTNLLSNAAKFSPPGSTIAVTVDAKGGRGLVTVSDEGPGIPAGRADELFEPFARLGAAQPGTGLGLYISRGIVRRHGGDLFLEPSATGARFVIALPSA